MTEQPFFLPKTARDRVSLPKLRADFFAGLTVAAISLPQCLAYAALAGVDPRFGFFTGIVFMAVAGLFGASGALVNGPTRAVALVVLPALAFIDPEARLESYEAMFVLAAMTGALQVALALCRFGDFMRFISDSVITGFVAGAALLALISQIGPALGVKAAGGQTPLASLIQALAQDGTVNPRAVALSLATMVLAVAGRALLRRWRAPPVDLLFALLATSVGAWLLGWSRAAAEARPLVALLDGVPSGLPALHVPDARLSWVFELAPFSLALSLLGALEALSVARGLQPEQRFDSNRQILAEGLGNLAGAFLQCMPGSGSLTRTAIARQAGAATRFCGVIAAGFVALAVVALGPVVGLIPKPALAGALIVVCARLIDPGRIVQALSASRSDALLVLVTAVSVVVVGVEYAIFAGAVLSALLYLPRAAELKMRELVVSPERVLRARLASDPPPRAVTIYDIEGELFFAAAPVLARHLESAARAAREQGVHHMVLRLKRVRNPDAVALEALDRFLANARAQNLVVLLAGLRPDFLAALTRFGIVERHSADLIFPEEERDYSATLNAVRRAYALATREILHAGDKDAANRQPKYYLV